MAIVNIDKLLEEEEPQGFILEGKEYIIPDLSYKMMKTLLGKQKEIENLTKTGDLGQVLDKNIELICSIIPDLDPKYIGERVSLQKIRHILASITQAYTEVEEGETEVGFYRKKYKDEYRKNELSPEQEGATKKES